MKREGYIVMLENDHHDRELSETYFRNNGVAVEFLTYSNEVMQLLHNRSVDRKPLPRIILLNANTVPDNGIHILQELRSSIHFRHIPVIMLCEYPHHDFVSQCYAAGANTVISKPFSDKMTDLKINTFIQYWFDVADVVQGGGGGMRSAK